MRGYVVSGIGMEGGVAGDRVPKHVVSGVACGGGVAGGRVPEHVVTLVSCHASHPSHAARRSTP